MFNFLKNSEEIVTISIDERNIICSWFKKDKKSNFFILKAYERYLIDNLEILNLIIFNPNQIRTYINSFLIKYDLKNAFIYLSFSGKEIIDEVIEIDDSLNNSLDFKEKINSKYIHYVYEVSKDKFYTVKIPYELIFQYKIFSILSRINLTKIVTTNSCLIQLIKYFKLDISLISKINYLETYCENFIESYDLNNCIFFEMSLNLEKEKFFVFRNLGLFLMGK